MRNQIDVVIPVLNEEQILQDKADYYRSLGLAVNLVFVDGGSSDGTVSIAQRYGRVVQTGRGRALQKNCGAVSGCAPILLFLHVDTFVHPHNFRDVIEACRKGVVAGTFTMRIEDDGALFRFYEWAVNQRARHQSIFDGDLGLFIQRSVFEQIEGFDLLPVMEDILIGKKLRRVGAVQVLPQSIQVSSRKWRERGFIQTFIAYTLAYLQLWTGLPLYNSTRKLWYRLQRPV